jgi:hypothetical protein
MTFDIASFVIGFVLCGVVIAWALELKFGGMNE